MNKKGQNDMMSATAQEGDCGLEPHQRRHVGTTDAPVQPNLLLDYRNQPRLSDGANRLQSLINSVKRIAFADNLDI